MLYLGKDIYCQYDEKMTTIYEPRGYELTTKNTANNGLQVSHIPAGLGLIFICG